MRKRCAGPRRTEFRVYFACSTPARVSHAKHALMHHTCTATHHPHGLTPPPHPHFCRCTVGLRRVPSPTVVPTPIDAPLAAGNHLGLFGYLHDELSTLEPSFFALRFVFTFGFTESGVRRGRDVSWRRVPPCAVCSFLRG